jgi:hypothetical protein
MIYRIWAQGPQSHLTAYRRHNRRQPLEAQCFIFAATLRNYSMTELQCDPKIPLLNIYPGELAART